MTYRNGIPIAQQAQVQKTETENEKRARNLEKGGFSAVGLRPWPAVSDAERASKFGAQKGPTWSSAVKRTRRQKRERGKKAHEEGEEEAFPLFRRPRPQGQVRLLQVECGRGQPEHRRERLREEEEEEGLDGLGKGHSQREREEPPCLPPPLKC